MDARLERSLRLLAVIAAAGTIAGFAVNFAQGRTSASSMLVGIAYGLLLSVAIGGTELFVLQGPMRAWLGDLSFTANLMVRSAIYAAIIVVIQFFQSG
jgi:adenylate cyclase